MDYKKKYEDAIERCKKEFNFNNLAYSHEEIKERLERVFPELKESEDERRIRKDLIGYFEVCGNKIFAHHRVSDIIAWLEKQGEQKANDKVEPKFKVGDFTINEYGFIMQIDGIDDNMYVYHVLDDNRILKHDITKTDKSCRLWTIQDARDGDVLVASDGSIFIFKEVVDCGCKHYIALTKDNETINVNDNLEHYWEAARGVKPATKKQRDLLFSKMKEAGYEWDAEKKELKKIKQKSVDNLKWDKLTWEDVNTIEEIINEVHSDFRNGIGEESFGKEVLERFREIKGNEYIDTCEQKPAWSEEDERYYDSALWHIKNSCGIEGNIYNWLKSLKERMKGE